MLKKGNDTLANDDASTSYHRAIGNGALQVVSASLRDAVAKGQRSELERLLRRDFTLIDTAGKVHSREDALAGAVAGQLDASGSEVARDYGTLGQITRRSVDASGGQRVGLEVWVNEAGVWRALIIHLNTIADPASPASHPPLTARAPDAPAPRCRNPLEVVPYEATTADERGIINSFQSLEKAVVHNRPDLWVTYVADEFIVYRTNQHPTVKAGRATALGWQREVNAESFVAEAETMKLWVFGDAAVMRADHVMPGNRRPPYRATRLWVKRDGRWLMALSQQTTRDA